MTRTGNEPTDGAWFREYHDARDADIGLMCFPHAGGAASFYFPMSAALAPAVRVLSVQYPGRQDRHAEPPFDDIHLLADEIFRAFRPLAGRRWVFFGHSMGATVAYELARRLDDVGTPPEVLLVSGRRAPSCPRTEQIHQLDDDAVVAELRALAGTDPRVLGNPELRELVLPLVRTDYRAIETYRPRLHQPLPCSITALIGDSDPLVTRGEAEAWREYTTGRFELRSFPGGHFYLNDRQDEVVGVVSAAITTVATAR